MKWGPGSNLSPENVSIYSKPIRQKINTKRSIESEVVGVNDVMPMFLWSKYFLEYHGYITKKNISGKPKFNALRK